MKIVLTIGLFCISSFVMAQPAGVMNTYTFPTNEQKTNLNGGIVGLYNNELFFGYYNGTNTTIGNTQENVDTFSKNRLLNTFVRLQNGNSIYTSPSSFTIVDKNGNTIYAKIYSSPKSQFEGLMVENDSTYYYTFLQDSMYYVQRLSNLKPTNLFTSKNWIDIYTVHNNTLQYNFINTYTHDSVIIYAVHNTQLQKIKSFAKPIYSNYIGVASVDSQHNYIFAFVDNHTHSIVFRNNNNQLINAYNIINIHNSFYNNQVLLNPINDVYTITNFITNKAQTFLYGGYVSSTCYMPNSKSYYITTDNNTLQAFSYIYKYPHIYNHTNASSTFSIIQDANKNIWFGSYQGKISYIDSNKVLHPQPYFLQAMNGGLCLGKQVYMIEERCNGIHVLNANGSKQQIRGTEGTTGYYLYKAKNNTIYYGTSGNGLWYISQADLLANNGKWHKIPTTRFGDINNILGITEDTLGRIWLGKTRNGFAIWNPKTDSLQLHLMQTNKSKIGIYSTLTDYKGTVWIGTMYDGLYYYNAYHQQVRLSEVLKVNHPFLNEATKITSMCLWKNYLLLMAFDKILALNLDSFYHHSINIQYLTKNETRITSTTEQNVMHTTTDGTVWFSTSDMVYNWDVQAWLNLPKEKIKLYTTIDLAKQTDTLIANSQYTLSPKHSTFEINLHYFTQDRLPRYISTAFTYENDSIVWTKTNTNTTFSYKNLKAGKYTFSVKIMELDGTLTNYTYKIIINSFWFEKWWILTLIGLAILGATVFVLNLRNQKKLALQKLLTTKAKAKQQANEMQKQLAQLQSTTLSNQLRPHFLLNTLNQIGAYIVNNPQAESIISRLGESIEIVFQHSLSNQNAHQLQNEITLVKNVVSIHKTMYLNTLQFTIQNENIFTQNANIKIPFGLLQVPIENALLHGLNNKQHEPYLLTLSVQDHSTNLVIIIEDNGIGIQAASILSNARKNGTGLKNLNALIQLLNSHNSAQIKIDFEEDIIVENNKRCGTRVIITLPKSIKYDIN